MRPTVLLHFAFAILLAGCAVEGVVVEKNSRPLPFVDSIGMDGIYKFKLRDAQGHICSQMVTPEVFFQYEVGDYFSDLQPARRSRVQLEDVRTVRTVQRVSPHPGKGTRVAQRHYSGTKVAHVHRSGKKVGHASHSGKKIVRAHNAKKKHVSNAQAHRTTKHRAKAQAHRKARARVRPS